MDQIRAFIAVQLPDDVKAELDRVSRSLASQIGPGAVRWVKPDRIHLTLRFLGDTAVSQLPEIAGRLDQITARQTSFVLELGGLGCFPNRRRPRVIWVGLKGHENELNTIRHMIDDSLADLGWKREDRPFRAHLTLGRVKDSRKLNMTEASAELKTLVVPVTAVHLIESELRPKGPLYTVRHTSFLGGHEQRR